MNFRDESTSNGKSFVRPPGGKIHWSSLPGIENPWQRSCALRAKKDERQVSRCEDTENPLKRAPVSKEGGHREPVLKDWPECRLRRRKAAEAA